MSRAFAYLTEALIVIGFIALTLRRTKIHVEREYLALIFISIGFLIALILVPGLSETMNMGRFYHILLFFIAPLCVVGVEFIIRLLFKRQEELKTLILLLVVIVPYFLCQTGFVYEVASPRESWSVSLSKSRMSPFQLYGALGYTDDYTAFGAEWISKNVVTGHTPIYSDFYSRSVLRNYGIYLGDIIVLSNTTRVGANGTVYLGPISVIQGLVFGETRSWKSGELAFLNDLNKLYSNGRVEISQNKP